jgi:putative copper export protein
MQEKLTILNAFVHDVATGTWIGSLVLLSILHVQVAKPEWALASGLARSLGVKFMWVTWVSLAVIMLTGVVRMVTWKVFGWTGDMERSRIQLLKVKHALLGVVFAAGTAYQALLVYGSW